MHMRNLLDLYTCTTLLCLFREEELKKDIADGEKEMIKLTTKLANTESTLLKAQVCVIMRKLSATFSGIDLAVRPKQSI